MATRIGTFRMDLGLIFDQPGTEPAPRSTSSASPREPDLVWALILVRQQSLRSADSPTLLLFLPTERGRGDPNPSHCLSAPTYPLSSLDPRPAPRLPDGHFHQKWAPLYDPRDTRAGTKGFVKVTLSLRARGDLPPPLPPLGPGHSSDIEK